MKYYDARIIEGCCVFSYEVKTPDRSSKNGAKRKKRPLAAWTRAMLRFFFLLILPFAVLGDVIAQGVRSISAGIRSHYRQCIYGREAFACILTSLSTTALIPLVLLLL